MLNWATDHIAWPEKTDKDETVVMTELKIVSAVPQQAIAQAPAQTKPKPKPRPRPHTQPPVQSAEPAVTTEAAPPSPLSIDATDQASSSLPTEAPQETAARPADESAGMELPAADMPPSQATDEAAPPAASAYRIDPPPSAVLNYLVQAIKAGQTTYGQGKITWNSNGRAYTVTGEASVLFFTVLNFQSEGEFDGYGVAPVLYAEKRFRRSETNTHFNRERNAISFSASTLSYPRKGGEQDRASVVWQLAGIGRGNHDKFLPDMEFEIVVAGTKDVDVWRIRVVGEEDTEVDAGKLRTWHVVRAPRQGSYDQKIDIWLAPQNEWYPVKIRYTEMNGDYLDLSLSSVRLIKAQ